MKAAMRPSPRRSSRALCWLVSLSLAAAYHIGDEENAMCWVTLEAPVAGCPTNQFVDCGASTLKFDATSDALLTSGSLHDIGYTIMFRLQIAADNLPPDRIVNHVNLHSCMANIGFCTPFVANSPGLSTHSVAQQVPLDANNTVDVLATLLLEAGSYTIIAHARWYDIKITSAGHGTPPSSSTRMVTWQV